MKMSRISLILGVSLLSAAQTICANEPYKGKEPPPIPVIKNIVAKISGIDFSKETKKTVDIHKVSDGNYLIIVVNNMTFDNGGPYQMLKLESDNWVIKNPTAVEFQFVE
ncbi:conserved exported hypothetical protein [Gammaproteobacteria bacterium]